MKFRKNYEPSTDKGMSNFGPSRTKQEFKEDADINNIIKKYKRTGLLPQAVQTQMIEGDFTDTAETYQEALNIVTGANSLFMGLPAELRAKFKNDPQNFLEFCENPKNLDELIELGLVEKRPATPASPPSPAPAQPAPAKAPKSGEKSPQQSPPGQADE